VTPRLGPSPDGALGFADPATEIVKLGDTEVWEVYNTTEDAHPIHLHLVKFQVIGRQKFTAADVDPDTGALSHIRFVGSPKRPAANETGWKDTVVMYPGEVTRPSRRSTRPGDYVGTATSSATRSTT
jgi:spore coat protein A